VLPPLHQILRSPRLTLHRSKTVPADLLNRVHALTDAQFTTERYLRALDRDSKITGLRNDSLVSCLTALAQNVLPENLAD